MILKTWTHLLIVYIMILNTAIEIKLSLVNQIRSNKIKSNKIKSNQIKSNQINTEIMR